MQLSQGSQLLTLLQSHNRLYGKGRRFNNNFKNYQCLQQQRLTETKYGPAKSLITPADVQMPMCPIIGNNHLHFHAKSETIKVKLIK